jgi:H+/gluconate symporter-like permease
MIRLNILKVIEREIIYFRKFIFGLIHAIGSFGFFVFVIFGFIIFSLSERMNLRFWLIEDINWNF